MNQQIESDKLFIKDVFERWYRIPEYQRPYVWGTDQITELLDDISQAQKKNKDSQYFLGSMVLKKTHKNDGNYDEYDLLDGQQRVTTLFLIVAVIRDISVDEDLINTCKASIFQRENKYKCIPERVRIVFDIRDQVKDFVDQYVKKDNGTAEIEALSKLKASNDADINIRNMANAILHIRRYFEDNDASDFFLYLQNKVLMIYVAAQELDDAFRLFTVMNNRGIKLRNSDILKAENLAVAPANDRAKYAKDWEKIETYFGEKFDNFLSHIRTILVKQKAMASLLGEFEDNIYNPRQYNQSTKEYEPLKPLLEKGRPTFEFISRYFANYGQIFDNDNYSTQKGYELYNLIAMMDKGFEADFWIAPILRFYDKFKANLQDEELINFIHLLDNKFATDWIVGQTPTTRIENMNAVIQDIDDARNIIDVTNAVSLKIDSSDMATLESLLNQSIYGRRAAKYLLLRLDFLFHNHTAKLSYPDTISVEHILPQNPDANSQWMIDFSAADIEAHVHNIGNLVLISRRKNSSQGNRDYSDKKTRYFISNIELFDNSIRIMSQYSTWTLNDLKNNQKEVVNKLIQSFW